MSQSESQQENWNHSCMIKITQKKKLASSAYEEEANVLNQKMTRRERSSLFGGRNCTGARGGTSKESNQTTRTQTYSGYHQDHARRKKNERPGCGGADEEDPTTGRGGPTKKALTTVKESLKNNSSFHVQGCGGSRDKGRKTLGGFVLGEETGPRRLSSI